MAVSKHKELGINVPAAKAYVNELNIDSSKVNGYTLLKEHIRPKVGNKSVCEILLSKGGVGKAKVFLPHAQGEVIKTTLAGMETYIPHSGLTIEELLFGVDYFTLRQNAKKEFAPPEVELVIGMIGHTVMLASPWNDPMTLTRAWCVFEVACTQKTGAQFESHLAPQDVDAMINAVKDNPRSFSNAFVNLDIRNCNSYDPDDKAAILDGVSKLEGGIHGTNVRLVEVLKNSYLPCLLAGVEKGPADRKLLNNAALVREQNGDLDTAETLYRRALAAYEEQYGLDHNYVAIACENIGRVLMDKGDLVGGEEMYRRALRIKEKAFGTEHMEVATTCIGFGKLLKVKGDLTGAEEMLRRALRIRETLGPEHYNVSAALRPLGVLLQEKGDLVAAEEMFKRSLRNDEKNFGLEHYVVAESCIVLGACLKEKGDITGAKRNLQRGLMINEQVWGTEHPETMKARNLLNECEAAHAPHDTTGT